MVNKTIDVESPRFPVRKMIDISVGFPDLSQSLREGNVFAGCECSFLSDDDLN